MYGRAGLSIGSVNRPSHQPLAWTIVRSHLSAKIVSARLNIQFSVRQSVAFSNWYSCVTRSKKVFKLSRCVVRLDIRVHSDEFMLMSLIFLYSIGDLF